MALVLALTVDEPVGDINTYFSELFNMNMPPHNSADTTAIAAVAEALRASVSQDPLGTEKTNIGYYLLQQQ
jgi:hypothetical protein